MVAGTQSDRYDERSAIWNNINPVITNLGMMKLHWLETVSQLSDRAGYRRYGFGNVIDRYGLFAKMCRPFRYPCDDLWIEIARTDQLDRLRSPVDQQSYTTFERSVSIGHRQEPSQDSSCAISVAYSPTIADQESTLEMPVCVEKQVRTSTNCSNCLSRLARGPSSGAALVKVERKTPAMLGPAVTHKRSSLRAFPDTDPVPARMSH